MHFKCTAASIPVRSSSSRGMDDGSRSSKVPETVHFDREAARQLLWPHMKAELPPPGAHERLATLEISATTASGACTPHYGSSSFAGH